MKKKKSYKILISKNGPYIVSGKLPLTKEIQDADNYGNPGTWTKGEKYPDSENYCLCRCGKSSNKPFCDGTHTEINFDGTETASNKKYLEQAKKILGPELDLTDAQKFCSSARFCNKGTWEHTRKSNHPKSKKIAIETACNCPSGRLIVWDKKTGASIEPKFEPSISLIQDKAEGVSGPIWVKGNIPIKSENGTKYEIRNRVTLCRCGKSSNKPFCDGAHIKTKFRDDQ
ncbi:MAG: CDGSH iron-sulfur domain-containing protein [Candidatus Nanoarchaeia archaeon]|nr:CDGSH iron-sulfur domain-containing protein [Candidatus Nanoarchaeia archaeon]